jgi:hypothetical protein
MKRYFPLLVFILFSVCCVVAAFMMRKDQNPYYAIIFASIGAYYASVSVRRIIQMRKQERPPRS